MKIETPYYLIDEKKLLRNLKIIERLHKSSGAKCVLALKCFSTWGVFGLMKKYLAGTTSSSLYEARLGHEKFGGETHAYCVAFTPEELKEAAKFSDKIVFNSVSQLKMFKRGRSRARLGLRANPQISYSHFDLADPARKFSRLGVADKKAIEEVLPLISGLMFHFNCENDDLKNLSASLDLLGEKYGDILEKLEWVSLGGGIYFTKHGYPLAGLSRLLKDFSRRHGVQVYLEPGESAIYQSAELVTKVLDVVHNEMDVAIVDASTEAHMLDLLIYHLDGKVKLSGRGGHRCMVAGRTCLAGDIFGTYDFARKPKVGDEIRFYDAAGYSMVKKNWFNGVAMPGIAVKRLNGKIDLLRRFGYKDFVESLG